MSNQEVTPLVEAVTVTENSETRVAAELRYSPPSITGTQVSNCPFSAVWGAAAIVRR